MAQQERIISADSHLAIKDEQFFAHLEKRHQNAILESRAETAKRMGSIMRGLFQEQPWPAAGRPGEWNPTDRLADMDIDKVDAEILYSAVDAGVSFYGLKDGGRQAAFEAFNNAALEFASKDPKRLLPVYVVPVAEVSEAVSEVHRLAKAGARAIMLPLYPSDLGLKPYWDRSWDPLWEAIQDAGLPISQHVGANSHLFGILAQDQTPAKGIFQSLPPIFMAETVAGWIVSGLLQRFPGLKIVLVEAGLGWIPYFLQRLDRMVHRHGWNQMDMIPELPSTYWHRSMAATFEEDEFGIDNRDIIGVDNLMWATDYPHPDSTWPESQKVIQTHFEDVPLEDRRKIVGGNAAKFYRLN